MTYRQSFVAALMLLFAACRSAGPPEAQSIELADPEANPQTKALFANLRALAPDGVLFGHQDDLAYGVTWKREQGRSDVREVTGAYPAVYGWEVGDLETGALENLDGVRFDDMQRWIIEGFERGGVITISWHMDNPVTGGSSWDTTSTVHAIIPGGELHDDYRLDLDRFARFVEGLRHGRFAFLGFGDSIPIVFRPFHEMTGRWFWWGRGHVTPEDYKTLWRFTVDYLSRQKGLHNLLYAYSTDVFDSQEDYLERYPGDAYVDVLGMDNYRDVRTDEGVERLSGRLRELVTMAETRGKLPAFTETGVQGIPTPTWWTDRLLRAIEADPVGRRISWVLVWRNTNEADNPGHHFAPYPGHPSAPNFIEFYRDPFVLFEDELPELYTFGSGSAVASR